MIDRATEVRAALLAEVLASREPDGSVDEIGRGAWVMPLGEDGLVYASVEGEWLQLSTPAIGGDVDFSVVERNRDLGGFAKLAVDGGDERDVLYARAELPVPDAETPCRDLSRTFSGLAGAAGHTVLSSPAPTSPLEDSDDPPALGALCREAGWESVARSEDHVAVDLGLERVPARANVLRSESGDLHVSASLPPVVWQADVCRDAVARLLLRSSSVVRMARPVVSVDPAGAAIGFEVCFAGTPSAEPLRHALSALHVALRRTGLEVAALAGDPGLARAFLGSGEEEAAEVDVSPTQNAALQANA